MLRKIRITLALIEYAKEDQNNPRTDIFRVRDFIVSRLYRDTSRLARMDGQDPVLSGSPGPQCRGHCRFSAADSDIRQGVLLRHMPARSDAGCVCLAGQKTEEEPLHLF